MDDINTFDRLSSRLRDKKIVYIATKNADYLRITQEAGILQAASKKSRFILSSHPRYFIRILTVMLRVLLFDFQDTDIVFVSFQAQFILPFLAWKFRGCEIWCDFFISLYDTLVFDRKTIKKDSLTAAIAWRLDKITLNKSQYVICDTKEHGKYFIKEFECKPQSVYTLYLEADKHYYYPQNIKKPMVWEDKFLVFYFGSMLPLQGIDVVLKAAGLLRNEEKLHFIIAGPVKSGLKKAAGDTVTCIDWLPQEELARYIAFCDLCLAGHFNVKIEKADRTIPGKAYIYDAMEKPMILGDSKANREYFPEDEKHIFVSRGDAKALADRIIRQYRKEAYDEV